ncbi:CopG family transcriptional regulator [Culicoidibacter larvae]|uniref:Uncharacterized protein n=1 Tax=Culicoidibacter larvae TaxID=2579976 RepID=A0A5R8Q7W9_9FIRM|nr:CopG family transcriptional regulator [Culicoidibacter larvae]TLG71147.1 hypothetical protein FEZ08_11370 [Culicoidibacter larvae]
MSRFTEKFNNSQPTDLSETTSFADEIIDAGKSNIDLVIPKKPKKKSTTYYLYEDLTIALENIAKSNKVSTSDLLNHILRQYLPNVDKNIR